MKHVMPSRRAAEPRTRGNVAWHGSIEHREMRDRGGVIGGESECGRRTPIMTDDDEALESEMVAHQAPEIASDGFFVIALRRTRGIAEPAQIGRDQEELVRQQRHQAAPLVPGLRPSMNQNYRAAFAERHVMQPHPLQIRVMMLEGRSLIVLILNLLILNLLRGLFRRPRHQTQPLSPSPEVEGAPDTDACSCRYLKPPLLQNVDNPKAFLSSHSWPFLSKAKRSLLSF